MSVAKYLNSYADPITHIAFPAAPPYDRVLCVPAYAEAAGLLDALLKNIDDPSLLIILVVNAPAGAQADKLRLSRQLVSHCRDRYSLIAAPDSLCSLLEMAPQRRRHLLLVDRTRPDSLLPPGQGVGLARKIACDLACRLIIDGRITSPWIHSTDADATLPGDYFTAVDGLEPDRDAAGIYPFIHAAHADGKVRLAQQLYDFSLHYYVEGLRWAGSPYAFHTIGSTLVINPHLYALARGFPRRQAGEDFYLLNKLAKLGTVRSLATPPITLASRISDRVPFGTGPALAKISALGDPIGEHLFYHPHCFSYLKAAQALLLAAWCCRETAADSGQMTTLARQSAAGNATDPDILLAALRHCGLEQALEHALSHSNTEKVYLNHMRVWFDAFQTLKFIHWLRDHHLPSQPLAFIRDATTLAFAGALEACAPMPPAWSRQPR